jgi:tetratricopeptide (TPR) repeat protein
MNRPLRLLAGCLWLAPALLSPAAGAADKGGENPKPRQAADVDYLSLGAKLLKDGHLDRAENALDKVNLGAEDLDRVRYYTVRGLVELKQGDLKPAKRSFYQAIDAGEVDRVVYVYLAQAHYRLKEYRPTIQAVERAGPAEQGIPSLYAIWARSHWQLDEPDRAWAALDAGLERFPEHYDFLRQQVFYLIELGLYKKAVAAGQRYLRVSEATPEDHMAIGKALRESGELAKAEAFLQRAALRFPDNPKVKIQLAQVHMDQDQLVAAADLYGDAARLDPTYMAEAAESYRRAGKLHQALNFNAQVADQAKKLKQRLAILVQLEQYERATGMEAALLRNDLLDNEDIRYALAYAYFQSRRFDAAERHLQHLTQSDLFRKAAKLRTAMSECRDAPWKCY